MKLWNDLKMTPIKGQLALLPAQKLGYLYGQNGYMFPRDDNLVIGGTFEIGENDTVADKAVCQGLVDHIASLFGKAAAKPLPDHHIHHPDNLAVGNPAMV
jgi:glycine/D-amino acid oxidase-like deaminating enzyme